jgi:putative tryptophan/tyrosine transport system substrate-binding protein
VRWCVREASPRIETIASATFEFLFAEAKQERLPELAAELVRLQVDVIVTWGTRIAAAKQATTTLPLVMASTIDAVGIGLVANLAQPGGNATGLTLIGSTAPVEVKR